MAKKRMFTMNIVDSDAFLDMPLSSQCLYFHLNMRADDDGFIGNPKRIARLIGSSEDDLKLLIVKKFVLTFENGVIVIKHWKMHNTLQNDRCTPTNYQDELKQLDIKKDKSYTFNKMFPKCFQNVSTVLDLDIDSDKDIDIGFINNNTNIYNNSENEFKKPTLDEIQLYADSIKTEVPIDCERFYDHYESVGWYVGKAPMVDWKAMVRKWGKRQKSAKELEMEKSKLLKEEEQEKELTDQDIERIEKLRQRILEKQEKLKEEDDESIEDIRKSLKEKWKK